MSSSSYGNEPTECKSYPPTTTACDCKPPCQRRANWESLRFARPPNSFGSRVSSLSPPPPPRRRESPEITSFNSCFDHFVVESSAPPSSVLGTLPTATSTQWRRAELPTHAAPAGSSSTTKPDESNCSILIRILRLCGRLRSPLCFLVSVSAVITLPLWSVVRG